ncbi:protein NRT1/ PTR FAMILY 2.13 [Impatiens glandulifera]|uniref:protein NRT1/ PTR FAMILY 2.13 n=1 Tax=Impatiens glandulifera TaxID=253017 RepID=UPI001FB10AE1|nr:protein NRT1/ PTR FAMILY 2.13 [Impatiens glandulifera]
MDDITGNKQRPSWVYCCSNSISIPSSPSRNIDVASPEKHHQLDHLPVSDIKPAKRKPGGWKAMPFVLGNETFERMGTFGLLSNFMIFLLTQFHLEQASAANLLNIWSGITNFAPLIGAFISDAYIGRFRTIAIGSFATLIGMITLTVITWVPDLHPPSCPKSHDQVNLHPCTGPTSTQLGVLVIGLAFLSIGTGGIRPCSLPFGIDQFDPTSEDGRRGINSFFNWYYATFTVVLILALTVVVYIQDNISWVIGFGIPTLCMVGSIILFFLGTKIYVHVKPEGSVFTGIAQALVAAYKKRHARLPDDDEKDGGVESYYDPPPLKGTVSTKLPLTNQFRMINKAALVQDGDLKPDGSRSNPWRLCSIQQIEEAKCLFKIFPVWASGIVCFTAIVQQATFTISQALKMDRHLGPKFEIPPGTLIVISMITVGIWVPFYDRVVVPALRKVTGIENGITLLQRIGIGIVFSFLSMVVAGIGERMRRASALAHGGPSGVAPISVLWLAPQLSLMGFAEAFNIIGQIEFYYREFPESMSSVANSLFFITAAGANYLSSFLIMIVHRTTGGHGRPNWLANDINAGRIENFYFLIAAMGAVNLVYFLFVSQKYQYKKQLHVELSVGK